jgi:hypothetical protein
LDNNISLDNESVDETTEESVQNYIDSFKNEPTDESIQIYIDKITQ